MTSQIYEPSCRGCEKDVICHFCGDKLCKACCANLDGNCCCKPCSASVRNQECLVSYFIHWHSSANIGDILLTEPPTLIQHKYKKGSTFAVAEFEGKDIMGSITYRSDAQCDLEVIRISNEKIEFSEYRILINETEINEFLKSVYFNVSKIST